MLRYSFTFFRVFRVSCPLHVNIIDGLLASCLIGIILKLIIALLVLNVKRKKWILLLKTCKRWKGVCYTVNEVVISYCFFDMTIIIDNKKHISNSNIVMSQAIFISRYNSIVLKANVKKCYTEHKDTVKSRSCENIQSYTI